MPSTITFQPRPELSECIETLVQTATYNSIHREVASDGLRLLQEKLADSKLKKLQSLIEEGDSSPDAEDFTMSAIKRKLDNI